MTALITEGQVAGGAWVALSWAFVIAVFGGALLIRKARDRGKRLFRDEPLARVRSLTSDHTHAHEMDGFQ